MLRGLVYDKEMRSEILEVNESNKLLFLALENFMRDVHSIVREEEEMEGHKVDPIQSLVLYFEEELLRFFSILPLEYSEEEMKERIPNLEFFEDLMRDKAAESGKMNGRHSN